MSDNKQVNIIREILKELMIKLDKKFEKFEGINTIRIQIENLQNDVDNLQTQLANFRAFTERALTENIKTISSSIEQPTVHRKPIVSPIQSSSDLQKANDPLKKPQDSEYYPEISKSSVIGSKAKLRPTGPSVVKILSKEMTPVAISEKLNIIPVDTDEYYKVQIQQKTGRKRALISYMEKLESTVVSTWPMANDAFLEKKSLEFFVEKGLTVLHGIIEFLFVGYRKEIPDHNLNYNTKAKNISGLGVFKDTSLLDKMEEAFDQLKRDGKQVVLPTPLVRGWHSRLSDVYEHSFLNKREEAYKIINQ